MTLDDVHGLTFADVGVDRGPLTAVESGTHVPFAIALQALCRIPLRQLNGGLRIRKVEALRRLGIAVRTRRYPERWAAYIVLLPLESLPRKSNQT